MRVMVIGASTDPSKYGNKAVRVYLRQGHTVLPVNPTASEIEGLEVYPDVSAVPGPIDRATVYLPPKRVLDVLPALAERGDVGELWLNPGTESDEVIDLARVLGFQPIMACSIVDVLDHP
ncbi:MAG: CoA-binding protein [Phycisphaera sp.]|nr:CoA-binding protein [Phycisphaera sp.]